MSRTMNTVLDLSSIDTSVIDFMMDVLTDDDFLSVLIDTLRIVLPRLGLVNLNFVILMMTLTVWIMTTVGVGKTNSSSIPNKDILEEELETNTLKT